MTKADIVSEIAKQTGAEKMDLTIHFHLTLKELPQQLFVLS